MRDKLYLAGFLLAAGLLLYVGRGLLARSALVTGVLVFAGTTSVGVLGLTLYQVQNQLRASRRELARKEAEINFAREVQVALFPRQFPADSGLEFSAVCVPAAGISGDYYDILELTDGRLAFAVADVSGKGLPAAILMSNLHAGLHILVEAGHSPAELCAQLNRHLCQFTEAYRFATLFYAEWSSRERRLTYVNAGHTEPFLVGANGSRRLATGSLPIGLFPNSEFHVATTVLAPGDLVVLYSDGITDAGVLDAEPFGDRRLEAVVDTHRHRPLSEIEHEVLTAVESWSGKEPGDDMTLMLVRATAGMGETS
jgi:phosphoserine phosphatase RsbU/P